MSKHPGYVHASAFVAERGSKFVPAIAIDSEPRLFTSPLPDADHVDFDPPAAQAYAENFLEELRKILQRSLQEAGFIVPADSDA